MKLVYIKIIVFFERIKPENKEKMIDFKEMLFWNLLIESISEYFISMNVGEPIIDPSRFKGCSGAPNIDTNGRLIALVTQTPDLNWSIVYGFIMDKLKHYI